MIATGHHPVVCFGEVLWDVLPTGKMPGGAPLNVAYHLQKLGKSPALITKTGDDSEGQELKNIFSAAGVCTQFFQTSAKHATGKVHGTPNGNNEMEYDIAAESAWDHIEWDAGLEDLASQSEYFVFGSLACRNDVSRRTLFKLLEAAKVRVLDINLRAPFYTQPLVTELLQNCDILKLNLAELELITGWFTSCATTEQRIEAMQHRFGMDTMVVTMGADGAVLCKDGIMQHQPGYPVLVADTVGAGDAFLAGLIAGFSANKSFADTLNAASLLGAFVASKQGACPAYTLTDLDNFASLQTKQISAIQKI